MILNHDAFWGKPNAVAILVRAAFARLPSLDEYLFKL
jgi:hypothetical protein